MNLQVFRGKEKGVVFHVKEEDGREYCSVKKKGGLREVWQLVKDPGGQILGEIRYKQKLMLPGCRIRLHDGKEFGLTARMGLRGGYQLAEAPLEGEIGSEHPFVLMESGKEAAWISLVRPGQEPAYHMWVQHREPVLCISALLGYVMCTRMKN
ncbi:MAG: hypothetical protein Q4D55_00620 [Eubacteriales bacterium]|nr:hypothetical protein [Eubacteriales bacterium]